MIVFMIKNITIINVIILRMVKGFDSIIIVEFHCLSFKILRMGSSLSNLII